MARAVAKKQMVDNIVKGIEDALPIEIPPPRRRVDEEGGE